MKTLGTQLFYINKKLECYVLHGLVRGCCAGITAVSSGVPSGQLA